MKPGFPGAGRIRKRWPDPHLKLNHTKFVFNFSRSVANQQEKYEKEET